MLFSGTVQEGRLKISCVPLSTLRLLGVRRDLFSQFSFSQESSPGGQYYLLFYKMTSPIEVLFVKYTRQVSQQTQLLISTPEDPSESYLISFTRGVLNCTVSSHGLQSFGWDLGGDVPWWFKSGQSVDGRSLCKTVTLALVWEPVPLGSVKKI